MKKILLQNIGQLATFKGNTPRHGKEMQQVVLMDGCSILIEDGKIAKIFDITLDDLLGLQLSHNKSKTRLEREQFAIEKLRNLNDKTLDFILDELILLFKYFK